MFFFSLLLFSIWLSLSRYEDNQNIYSFIYPTYLLDSVSLLVWGGIGISIHVFSLWFYVLFCVRRYRYIYLPPWTYPLFGARVYHMVQIPHHSQLNKIRILFNSPSLYTHIYPYTTVYHCISCIYITVYHLHLPLRQDYHAMHKRIQARICTTVYTVYTHKRRSTDALCKAKPEKVRI